MIHVSSVPGPSETPRVRVQDLDSQGRSERRKKNAIFDQQVGTGKEFILIADDLNADEYSNPICEVRMKFEEVNGQRVLKCLEPNCGNPNFGSQFTSSAYHAAVHFRSKHLKSLLICKQKPKRAKYTGGGCPGPSKHQIIFLFGTQPAYISHNFQLEPDGDDRPDGIERSPE